MLLTTKDVLADLEFTLQWQSDRGRHTEIMFGGDVNFWRDVLPGDMGECLLYRAPEDCIETALPPGVGLPDYSDSLLYALKPAQFDGRRIPGTEIIPRAGRFYPKGLLKDIAGVFRENLTPFRLLTVDETRLIVDFNHPLAGFPLTLSAVVKAVREKRTERGGGLTDWLDRIAGGPGMQVRSGDTPTDFFSGRPYERTDETPDAIFYQTPRLVHHLDAAARKVITGMYRSQLFPGARVLDLMSSRASHLPEDPPDLSVTGLGMNSEELSKNGRLSERVIRDLNQTPRLPFPEAAFDVIVCTASVEYLTAPVAVFQEANRVLKPGGRFIVTFSDRWFPPKAIRVWTELHPFERMGIVSEYFLQAGGFTNLTTTSVRGLPRPTDDKYYPERLEADPVFMVSSGKEK